MTQTNLAKSIDLVLRVDGKIVGGQQNAVLTRKAEIINITNKINGEWQENLTGLKSWSINCNGLYIMNSPGLNLLEEAFLNNKKITVSFTIGNKQYEGECLIVDYPLNAIFNTQFKYSLKFFCKLFTI